MMKLGLCCGSGLCCTLLCGVLLLGGGAAIFGQAADAPVAKSEDAGAPCATAMKPDFADVDLTADEQKVVDYLADLIESGEMAIASEEVIKKEVGLSIEQIEQLDHSKLRAGVMAELTRRDFDLSSLGGNCTKYRACSVDRNLMNATGSAITTRGSRCMATRWRCTFATEQTGSSSALTTSTGVVTWAATRIGSEASS